MSSALRAGAHRADADGLAGQLDLKRLLLLLALDGELHRRVDRAAHLVHGLMEGQALHGLAVDLGDDVVGQNASPGGRRIVDRGDDLDEPLLHRDLDAEPAELAVGFGLHLLELVRAHVA